MYGTGAEKLDQDVDGYGRALTSLTGPMMPLIFMTDRSVARAWSLV